MEQPPACTLCAGAYNPQNGGVQQLRLCGRHIAKLAQVASIPPVRQCRRCYQYNPMTTINGETLCQKCWNSSRCKKCRYRQQASYECGGLCERCDDPPSWDE